MVPVGAKWCQVVPGGAKWCHARWFEMFKWCHLAPFSNCLIQNGDLGGEVELINLPLIFVVYCSNYNGAPVKMVSLSTVPPPPVESETLHGRLEKGAREVAQLDQRR